MGTESKRIDYLVGGFAASWHNAHHPRHNTRISVKSVAGCTIILTKRRVDKVIICGRGGFRASLQNSASGNAQPEYFVSDGANTS